MKDKHLHTALGFDSNECSIMLNPKANYLHRSAVAEYSFLIFLSMLESLLGVVIIQYAHSSFKLKMKFNYEQAFQWNVKVTPSVLSWDVKNEEGKVLHISLSVVSRVDRGEIKKSKLKDDGGI